MHYISTRGQSADEDFSGVLMRGLALDGGLYVPQVYLILANNNLTVGVLYLTRNLLPLYSIIFVKGAIPSAN